MSLLFVDAKLISDFFADIWVCKSLLKYSTYMNEQGGAATKRWILERIFHRTDLVFMSFVENQYYSEHDKKTHKIADDIHFFVTEQMSRSVYKYM
jgi:hypothetical protein